jgi:hypothetical protein
MCSAPKIKTPPPVQDAKQPDLDLLKRSRKGTSTMGNGALLTGAGGLSDSMPNTGATTLLGA